MKRLFYYLLIIVSALPLQAQILNGDFESWGNGEPANWNTNNAEQLSAYPITQSTFVHNGSYSLKGEVVGVEAGGQTVPYPPSLSAGNMNQSYFSFSSKPDVIRGYFHFEPVGGDGFQSNIIIGTQSTVIAAGELVTYAPTGAGYHELVYYMNYIDTVTQPTLIIMNFSIVPPPGGTLAHIGSVFYLDDLPKVTLIKPAEEVDLVTQTVFISGETDTIKWNSGGAEYVDLEYSVDNGASYNSIFTGYPGDSSRYFWKVPSDITPTRNAKIRLTDTYSGREVKSITFTIKPWQLTRYTGSNELELFEPNQDGWSFANSDTSMWPGDWYGQFDYQFGTDPHTDFDYPYEEPFLTAQSSDFCDWPLFVDVFGESQCYYGGIIYRGDAEDFWGGIKKKWGGSCFGFSATSLLAFYHKSALLSRFPGIGSFGDLHNVGKNDSTRKAINHFYTLVYSRLYRSYTRRRLNDTPQDLLKQLKAMFRKENGDGKSLYYRNSSGTSAHSVVPYKMTRIGSSPQFSLKLYDNRFPSTTKTITIDSLANNWTDNTGLGWGTQTSGCYLEPESGDLLSPPLFGESPVQYPAGDSPLGDSSRVFVYNTEKADILITSAGSGQAGFQDTMSFNNIAGAVVIVPPDAAVHPPAGYDLPVGNYSLELSSFTDTSAYVYFFTDSTIYSYRRSGTLNSETDNLSLSEEGLGLENPDQSEKIVDVRTLILQDSTAEKKFTTDGMQISAGGSVQIGEKDRNKLLIKNYGAASDYNLNISAASTGYKAVFLHNSVPLDQNSGHQIVPDWNNLESSPVKILIDLGNDGTIDDSIFVDNQTVGIGNGIAQTIPAQFRLLQNYPNPFNPATTITFDLPEETRVNLTVYNILGEQVAVLINRTMKAGRHRTDFNASALPSGIYFYRVSTEKFSAVKKMILIK
jgi:hypothetical protein